MIPVFVFLVYSSAMTLDDEKRSISNVICGFVRKISFGRDLEQQLSFYVESRASFTNLDIILVQLIQVDNTNFLQSLNSYNFENRFFKTVF